MISGPRLQMILIVVLSNLGCVYATYDIMNWIKTGYTVSGERKEKITHLEKENGELKQQLATKESEIVACPECPVCPRGPRANQTPRIDLAKTVVGNIVEFVDSNNRVDDPLCRVSIRLTPIWSWNPTMLGLSTTNQVVLTFVGMANPRCEIGGRVGTRATVEFNDETNTWRVKGEVVIWSQDRN